MARRQEYVKGGRSIEHRVMVTPAQEEALKERAEALGVTIPKLLIDTTLEAPVEDKRAIFLELSGFRRRLDEVHRTIANEAENINAAARTANYDGSWDEEEWEELRKGIAWRNEKLADMFEGWKK